jgi:hypothetical protein
MTKQDYIEIAKILNEYQKSSTKGYYSIKGYICNDKSYTNMIDDFCTMFKLDNRHFDKQKFIDAVNN